jgi:hypothetical protein
MGVQPCRRPGAAAKGAVWALDFFVVRSLRGELLQVMNGILERTMKSLRWELLDHIRVATVRQLGWYLDEYRAYWNSQRCHQGIDGQTPIE